MKALSCLGPVIPGDSDENNESAFSQVNVEQVRGRDKRGIPARGPSSEGVSRAGAGAQRAQWMSSISIRLVMPEPWALPVRS